MGGSALALHWMPDYLPGVFGGENRAETLERCRTMAFTLLAVSPLFHALNCRSRLRSAFGKDFFSNRILRAAIAISLAVHVVTIAVPALHPVFRTHFLSLSEWGLVIGLSALPVPVFEVVKLVERALSRGAARA